MDIPIGVTDNPQPIVLQLADEQGVLRTVLGHHDDYDRVREKLLVARKVALGVAVGR